MFNWIFSQGGKDPQKMSVAWWFDVYILYLYISLYQYVQYSISFYMNVYTTLLHLILLIFLYIIYTSFSLLIMMRLYTYQSTTFDGRLERERQFDWNIETLQRYAHGCRKTSAQKLQGVNVRRVRSWSQAPLNKTGKKLLYLSLSMCFNFKLSYQHHYYHHHHHLM